MLRDPENAKTLARLAEKNIEYREAEVRARSHLKKWYPESGLGGIHGPRITAGSQ